MIKIFFYVFLVSAAACLGQEESYIYTNTNYVNEIALVDTSLYAATNGGLLRIHTKNYSVTTYTVLSGLPAICCKALAMDSSHNLWIGFNNGTLAKLDTKGVFEYFTAYRQAGWSISHMRYYHNYLIIAADKGLSLFSTDRKVVEQNFTTFNTIRSKPIRDAIVVSGMLFALAIDPDNQKDSIASVQLNWDNLRSTNLNDPAIWATAPVPYVLSLGQRGNNIIYSGGLDVAEICGSIYEMGYHYVKDGNPGDMTGLNSAYLASFGEVFTCVAGDDQCGLWAGSAGGGVLYFNGTAWRGFPQTGPPMNMSQYIYIDRNRRTWITTGSDLLYSNAYGIMKFEDGQWQLFNSFNTPAIADIRYNYFNKVLDHPTKHIVFFATWGGGIISLDSSGQWRNYGTQNSPLISILTDNNLKDPEVKPVSDLAFDCAGRIWASEFYAGIVVMDVEGKGKRFLTNHGGDKITHIAFDTSQYLWVGYEYPVVAVFDTAGNDMTGRFTRASIAGKVTALEVDVFNHVWVGTTGGLYRFSRDSMPGTWTQSLIGEEIRDVAFAPQTARNELPIVFAASFGHGVRLLDTDGNILDSLCVVNSGLVSNRVNGLFFDTSTAFLWIASEEGISVIRTGLFPSRSTFDSTTVSRYSTYYMFDKIPDFSDIFIYSLDGYLIKQIRADSQRDIRWYINNQRANAVRPGLYYYVIKEPGGKIKSGKLLVDK